MVRIRLGSTWKQDPDLRAALALGGRAAAQAAKGAIDALALEIDGVDVVAGRAEGALLTSVEDLGTAVLRLLAGTPRTEVHFSEGGVDLLLARRGGSALLTVVSLARPARVLVKGVEVDLAELASAVRSAALQMATDLETLERGKGFLASRSPRLLADRLGTARTKPSAAPPVPEGTAAPRLASSEGAPTCAVEIVDEAGLVGSYRGPGPDLGSLISGGRVTLRSKEGRELVSVSGPPFLLLRDLAAFAELLARAQASGEPTAAVVLALPGRNATVNLEADLAAGTLRCDGSPPRSCPALPLARAILEATVDYCGIIVARNAWQAENAWLAELKQRSAERLAHVKELLAGDVVALEGPPVRRKRSPALPRTPLGPGRIRRLLFRRVFEVEVGAPAGFGLAVSGERLVLAGANQVLGLDARRGVERWRHGGALRAALCGEALLLVQGSHLALVEIEGGGLRWVRELDGLPEVPREMVKLAGGLALVVGFGSAAALDLATGRTVWSFAPPAARELRASAIGRLAVVGSDAGFIYGVEALSGRTAWRLRLPGRLVADPGAVGQDCLALCATEFGGSLIALDPSTGRRRLEVPLDVAPRAGPVPFAGLWAVAGSVAGDPVVVAIDRAGHLAFEAAPPFGTEPVALTGVGTGLLVKTSRGACVALDRTGLTLWARPARALHPPPANAPALVARGVALVAGEHLEALDLKTGELVGEVPLVAPVRLAVDPDLCLFAMDASGVASGARLETHLSVL
jgi:outer membrane protein assembly factor BamB